MLSLKKNFGFALIGNLGYAASQYIILLIFIKLFSTEDVGEFIFAGAFATPLMMALEMQLRSLYVTEQNQNLSFNDYNFFRLFTVILGVLGLGITAYIVKPDYFFVILIVIFIKGFESQLDLLYGVYQRNHQLNYVAYSRILRGVVAVIVVATFSFFFKSILISLLGYLLSWFLIYFLYERKLLVERGFITKDKLKIVSPEWRNIKYLLLICFPMFLAIFVDKYYLNYPRISVEKFFGVKALAIFGSLLYFKSLGSQVISSLAQAAIPKMTSYVKDNKIDLLNKLLFKMILLGCLVGGLLTTFLYFFGEQTLRILYTEEYATYSDVLVVILIGTTITFSYIFISTALTALRKQWIKLPISVIAMTVLYFFINFSQLDGIIDIAKIVLYIEVVSFVLYFSAYAYFLRFRKVK